MLGINPEKTECFVKTRRGKKIYKNKNNNRHKVKSMNHYDQFAQTVNHAYHSDQLINSSDQTASINSNHSSPSMDRNNQLNKSFR